MNTTAREQQVVRYPPPRDWPWLHFRHDEHGTWISSRAGGAELCASAAEGYRLQHLTDDRHAGPYFLELGFAPRIGHHQWWTISAGTEAHCRQEMRRIAAAVTSVVRPA